MIEEKLFDHIPKGKFHSGICTTYGFNFHYFDNQVLPAFTSKGITNISVLMDSAMLSSELGKLSRKGMASRKKYSLLGVRGLSIFHPKVMFLAGDSSAMAFVGSGNITFSGHSLNNEIWNLAYADSIQHVEFSFLRQVFMYLRSFFNSAPEVSKRQIEWIVENCDLLHSSAREENNKDDHLLFLTNSGSDSISIFKKLRAHVPKEKVTEMVILCPYFDINGEALNRLYDEYQPQKCFVILPDIMGQPPIHISRPQRFIFQKWSELKKDVRSNFLHAKIIVFQSDEFTWYLSGSPNVTMAGLGLGRTPNEEAAVLTRRKREDPFEQLGIERSSISSDLQGFKVETQKPQAIEPLTTTNEKIIVISAEKLSSTLTLQFKPISKPLEVEVYMFDMDGKIVDKQPATIPKSIGVHKVRNEHLSDVFFLWFFKNEKPVSNRCLVQDVLLIERTNPSKENRNLNNLLHSIQYDEYDPLQMLHYYLFIGLGEGSRKMTSVPRSSKKGGGREDVIKFKTMSYQEYDQKLREKKSEFIRPDPLESSHVRILNALNYYNLQLLQRQETGEADHEETEDVSTSRGVAERERKFKKVSGRTIESYRNKLVKHLSLYREVILQALDHERRDMTLIDLAVFLNTCHMLIKCAGYEVLQTQKIGGRQTSEKVILLPVRFQRDRSLSFSSGFIEVCGIFSRFLQYCAGWKADGPYQKEKLEQFLRQSVVHAFAGLALIHRVNYGSYKRHWTYLNAINISRHIPFKDDFDKLELKRLLGELSVLGQIDLSELATEMNHFLGHRPGHIVDVAAIGYCCVVRTVPPHEKILKARFWVLSHPGYGYNSDKNDYLLTEYYERVTGRLFKGLESLKD